MTASSAPTRAELLRSRRLLARVGKGASLLRRKREALVHELFPLARPATEARRAIADAATDAYQAELEALDLHGEGELAVSSWPTRELSVDVTIQRLWGVTVPRLGPPPAWARGLAARATAPAATAPVVFETANRFERLAAELLDAASRELHVRSLGAALARTSRQLHTLEHKVAPALRDRIAAIGRALDEREREEHTRLRQLRRRRA